MTKGLFITVEGGEGSGKTTLCNHICSSLESYGYDLILTREPGGSSLSEYLRDVLLNTKGKYVIGDKAELILFLASRAQHIEEKILPALIDGKIVICDRFNDSSIAYQGFARNLGMDYVSQLCKLATHGISKPNLTFLLDLDPVIGMERIKKLRSHSVDRMELEELQFHRDVRQGYLKIADEHPNRIIKIDASKSFEFVFQSCLRVIKSYFNS